MQKNNFLKKQITQKYNTSRKLKIFKPNQKFFARGNRKKRIPWFKKLRSGKSKKILYWQKRNKYFNTLLYLAGKKHFIKYRKRLKKQLKKKLTLKNFYRQFYGAIKNRKLKKKINNIKNKKKAEVLLMNYLEQGLSKYLCRLGFVKYMSSAKLLVLNNFVSVNKRIINNPDHVLWKGDIICLDPILWYNLKLLCWKQIIKKSKKTSAEINYDCGIAVIYKNQSFFNLRKSALVKRKVFLQLIAEYR